MVEVVVLMFLSLLTLGIAKRNTNCLPIGKQQSGLQKLTKSVYSQRYFTPPKTW